MKKTLPFLCVLLLLVSCSHRDNQTVGSASPGGQHARWFTSAMVGGFRTVTVLNPFDTTQPAARLVLLPRGSNQAKSPEGFTQVTVPLQRVAVTSSTALTFAEKCGHLDAVVSVSDAAFVFNPVIRNRLAKGEVTEIAQGTEIWYEKLSASNPEAIFVTVFDGQSFERINDLGIAIIPFADYLETTPLGRAEWIKFMGYFFGEEASADRQFDTIATRYQRIVQLAGRAAEKPEIFDGLPIEGSWYISGGQSYMAAMYRDASASYLWNEVAGSGSQVMAFEKVFAMAAHTPFWRMVVNIPDTFTTARLLNLDERYRLFDAVRTGGVIWSNAASTPLFELGVAEPDVVLADLVSILHPGLLPHHQPRYYYSLRP